MRFTKLLATVLAAVMIIFGTTGCSFENQNHFDDSCLTVYFFDVGQADSSLLLFPDGAVMLIDTGNKSDGALIADFLREQGIKTIDYLVLTHPHEDHIGGAYDIFNMLKISTVCLPNIPKEFEPESSVYTTLLECIDNENCKTVYLSANSNLLEKSNYNVSVLSPGTESIYSDLNNYSVSLLVNCFTNTLIFMGDAEEPAEQDILRLNKNLDADILKVGHHGSANSSSAAFLNALTPAVSVISCGKDNSYGHPTKSNLERLQNVNSNIYRTDTVGTIIVKCYDGGFNLETDNKICLNGD